MHRKFDLLTQYIQNTPREFIDFKFDNYMVTLVDDEIDGKHFVSNLVTAIV